MKKTIISNLFASKEKDPITTIYPDQSESFIQATMKHGRYSGVIRGESRKNLMLMLVPLINDAFQTLNVPYDEGIKLLQYAKMGDKGEAVINTSSRELRALTEQCNKLDSIQDMETENKKLSQKLKQTEDEMDKLKALTEGKVARYEKIISQKDDDIRALNKEIKRLEHRLKEMEQKTILPFEEE
ncbi:MAG: hypothetical protein J6M44_14695 [Butyrivibrio sp.]|nr:hypothetical protein [Butyrivibrio sp.]